LLPVIFPLDEENTSEATISNLFNNFIVLRGVFLTELRVRFKLRGELVLGGKGNYIIVSVLLKYTRHISGNQDIIKVFLNFLLFETLKVRFELLRGTDYFP